VISVRNPFPCSFFSLASAHFFITVKSNVSIKSPAVTVIMVLPDARAVITPILSMNAIAGLLDL